MLEAQATGLGGVGVLWITSTNDKAALSALIMAATEAFSRTLGSRRSRTPGFAPAATTSKDTQTDPPSTPRAWTPSP